MEDNKKKTILAYSGLGTVATLTGGLFASEDNVYAAEPEPTDWEHYEPTPGDEHPEDGAKDEVDIKSTPTPTETITPTPTPEEEVTPTPTPVEVTPTPEVQVTPVPVPKTDGYDGGNIDLGIGIALIGGALVFKIVSVKKKFKKEEQKVKKMEFKNNNKK